MGSNRYFTLLALPVVALAIGLMAVSFLTDYLQASGFFNDVYISDPVVPTDFPTPDIHYNWGYRHYVYFWMGIVLFIISAARIIIWLAKNAD